MQVTFEQLEPGDFFVAVVNAGQDTLLYQKVEAPGAAYNAVLVNTGRLCNLYTGYDTTFKRVEVSFEIRFL